mmetsp:Transcript_8835/g.30371  ORF Transcript_8835/g.30371 Transcript_8835/m.30371 type:complete len:382 (+) Transcript_8835:666-1811(+)
MCLLLQRGSAWTPSQSDVTPSGVDLGEDSRARVAHNDLVPLALLRHDGLPLFQVPPVKKLVQFLIGDVDPLDRLVLAHGLRQNFLHLLQREVDLLLHVVLHERAILDDEALELELGLGLGQHVLLHRVGRDQPEHQHGLGLANPVAPVHGLQVLLRVPVRVVDHHGIRRREVDAQTPGSRREQKVVEVGVLVERVNGIPPVRQAHTPVDPASLLAHVLQVDLEQVQHLGHLREDEDLVAVLVELGEEPVQELHLPTLLDELVPGGERGAPVVLPCDQVRVVAVLPHLHQDVPQLGDVHLPAPVKLGLLLQGVLQSPVQELPVDLGLVRRHGGVQDDLLLHRQGLLDVGLEPAKKEGPQDVVQLLHDSRVLQGGLLVVLGHI